MLGVALALLFSFWLLAYRKLRHEMAFDYSKLMKKDEDPPAHHFWVELDPFERDALVKAVQGRETDLTGKQTANLNQRLKDARLVDGPRLAEARLDWDELERAAEKQGCSAADVIWDRGKGKET